MIRFAIEYNNPLQRTHKKVDFFDINERVQDNLWLPFKLWREIDLVRHLVHTVASIYDTLIIAFFPIFHFLLLIHILTDSNYADICQVNNPLKYKILPYPPCQQL